jgi:membrane dipeptidase
MLRRVFDLHCDTLTECMKQGKPLVEWDGHISLMRGGLPQRWVQVFAVFVPDPLRGMAAFDYAMRCIDFFETQRTALNQVCTPLLAIENGSALNGDLRNLDLFAARGVKLITLTWNGENELGCGACCDPARGLNPFGEAALQHMFALGIRADVSHLNEAGFWDAYRLAMQCGTPLMATHSCCAAIQPHPRNLTDVQLRALFDSGGLVGLNLYTEFLGGDGSPEQAVRHLAHLLTLGGGAQAAFGSDFDGSTVHPDLAGIDRLGCLDEAFCAHGLSQRIREAFFWGNAARFFGMG